MENILEPAKNIEDKYRSHVFTLMDGKVVAGLVTAEDGTSVTVVSDPLQVDKPTVIQKSNIEERTPSRTSIMPQGVLNKLTREEILDLLAYVIAKGDAQHMLFKQHEH